MQPMPAQPTTNFGEGCFNKYETHMHIQNYYSIVLRRPPPEELGLGWHFSHPPMKPMPSCRE